LHAGIVSILVLVDVALELDPETDTANVATSFNPCSRGCRSGTHTPRLLYRRANIVSILVLVDVALELARADEWTDEAWGFNPCSRGCRSGTLAVDAEQFARH